MLCFIKIFNDTNTYSKKNRIYKLLVVILLYIKTKIIDTNNVETLTLLYKITRNYNSKSL